MRCRFRPSLLFVFAAVTALVGGPPADAHAQMEVVEPFKVGTFEIEGRPEVGVV
ncbi:MAG: hypothetical protein GWM90_01510, partial [Gemmatimonadetes bacterium]|nr:hypothetical protein [Gemmatimonadota bacterium]NIR34792.1 hypothetical protein [Actinomycetota bacterium]NIU72368.1 hypothetical protein [Gammaproteobacteria bacterium]NIX42850.1 hypothetical protein [Gemmatimonadota bacterium]NIY07027.1 hypothetical protein [Gemmatimonadota bacterium]